MLQDNLRNLAIDLLDDDGDGVNANGYRHLETVLAINDCYDIINAVKVSSDNRFYLREDDAAELRQAGHKTHLFSPETSACVHCGILAADDCVENALCVLEKKSPWLI